MENKTELQKRIYAELNLEKWSIWQPTYTNNNPKRRILEREISLHDGSRIIARVEVGFSDLGVLTTDDQKVYYALIKMWEEDGRPSILCFSLRRLAKVLNKPWSGAIANTLSQSLKRLQATPFAWIDSYYDSTTKKNITIEESFNILANLHLVKDKVGKRTTKQECRCKFNDLIDNNLRNNHTKPLLFDTIIQFTSGITQLLYKHVDLVMADKSHYERRTELLFQDLQLEGEGYKKPSVRKRILEKACKEIDGQPISTGFLKATIKQTEDGKDYKVVFDKVKGTAKQKTITVEATTPQQPEKTVAPPHSKQKAPVSSATHDLVNYFYQLFHNLDTCTPTDKEVSQAASLINSYGLDLAKYTIEFAKTSSEKTNFQPQSFGGIVQYAPKAAADFTRKQQEQIQQQVQLQQQTAQQNAQQNALLQQEEEACVQMQTHLKTLLLDRYESLEQTVKQQLVLEMPWLAKLQPTAIMFRSALYKEMLHQAKQGLGQ